MKNKISVVIPVFNGEKFIQETLDSLYAQTYRNYEIIVADGKSNDRTLEILEGNKFKISKIISGPDKGMYDAANKGFQLATGDIFCYLNSDDRLLPEAFERVVAAFENTGADLVFGDVNYISETGKLIYSLKAMKLPKLAIRYLRRLPFAQQSSFWTRQIYQEIGGFDSGLSYVADSKFFFDIYLHPTVKTTHVAAVLGEFRMHNQSFSIGATKKMFEESQRMRSSYDGLRSNVVIKSFFELILKVINLKGIYLKKTYKGVRLR